ESEQGDLHQRDADDHPERGAVARELADFLGGHGGEAWPGCAKTAGRAFAVHAAASFVGPFLGRVATTNTSSRLACVGVALASTPTLRSSPTHSFLASARRGV